MKIATSLLVAGAVLASAKPQLESLHKYSYDTYVKEFNKEWQGDEYATRKELFEERVQMMLEHNDGGHGWKMNVNQFADLLDVEIKAFKGYNPTMAAGLRPALKKKGLMGVHQHSGEAAPKSVDWRTSPFLSPIKNQGGCGSCWAFSATESMEFFWNKKNNVNVTASTQTLLAPQQIVDCTPNPDHCGGTGGCSGATAELGFAYAITAGVALSDSYPYTAQTDTCKTNVKKVAHFSKYVKLPENNFTALVDAIAQGPVSISVDAGAWSFYDSGIYTPRTYASVDLDHAVQAVGYGTSDGTDYWLVRNSWGEGWGESGYIRLKKNDGSKEYCGQDKTPGDGSGCTGGPSEITACGNSGILYDSCYIEV